MAARLGMMNAANVALTTATIAVCGSAASSSLWGPGLAMPPAAPGINSGHDDGIITGTHRATESQAAAPWGPAQPAQKAFFCRSRDRISHSYPSTYLTPRTSPPYHTGAQGRRKRARIMSGGDDEAAARASTSTAKQAWGGWGKNPACPQGSNSSRAAAPKPSLGAYVCAGSCICHSRRDGPQPMRLDPHTHKTYPDQTDRPMHRQPS